MWSKQLRSSSNNQRRRWNQPATKLQDCSSSGSGYLVNAMAHGATTDVEAGQEKFDRGVRIGERWYGRRITPGLERTIHDDATPPTSATARPRTTAGRSTSDGHERSNFATHDCR
mmetsp:Transcript_20153/g.56130  ORF Transcript_20153/g.56130 Transcript_20153/m.56130 type:complete len:115 (-) Transcript_20153:680-1024(-)